MKPTLLMQTAYLVSQESKCVSWKVGAIIVKDGRIISTGVNGSPSGGVNCCDHAHDEKWMTSKPYTNSKYLVKSMDSNTYYETNIEPPIYLKYWEIPYEAHIAYMEDGKLTFYMCENDTTHIWTNDVKYTKEWETNCNPEMRWVDTHKWFTDFTKSQRPLWKSKNLDDNLRPLNVLDKEHREKHSEWSNVNEIHAEMNALLFSSKHGLSVNGATMYVTLSPCIQCAKAIAQSGIKQLVYCETYDRNIDGWADVLVQNGVAVNQLNKQNLSFLNWDNVKNYGGM